MALYAAKCMTDSVDELGAAGAFDLFVHATRFFGYKVGCTALGHQVSSSLVHNRQLCSENSANILVRPCFSL